MQDEKFTKIDKTNVNLEGNLELYQNFILKKKENDLSIRGKGY